MIKPGPGVSLVFAWELKEGFLEGRVTPPDSEHKTPRYVQTRRERTLYIDEQVPKTTQTHPRNSNSTSRGYPEDLVRNTRVCAAVMTFPCATSIRLQAAYNFLFSSPSQTLDGHKPYINISTEHGLANINVCALPSDLRLQKYIRSQKELVEKAVSLLY